MRLGYFIAFKVKTIIGALFLIFFGLIFIFVGGGDFSPNKSWPTTEATIIYINPTTKTPYIEFTTKEGEKVPGEGEKAIPANYYDSRFKVGDKMKIRYNPDDPYTIECITPLSFRLPFIIPGCVVVVTGLLIPVRAVFYGIYTRKRAKEINDSYNLEFVPMFLLEYKPLTEENKENYIFMKNPNDRNNYIVKDSKGEVLFFTQRIGKHSKYVASTYQLVDRFNKESAIVKLRKSLFASKNDEEFRVVVNGKSLNRYFIERHVTFDYKNENDRDEFNMYYNGEKIANIKEDVKISTNVLLDDNPLETHSGVYSIISAKENIDDAALFILCLTYR